MKYVAIYLLSILLLAGPGFAHDEKLHKGKSTDGKVLTIEGDSIEVKTEKGTVVVSVMTETNYELGTKGKPAKKSDLKEGDFVMVSGPKLESGKIAAKAIMIHPADAGSKAD